MVYRKKQHKTLYVGIDPSLTETGYAVFNSQNNETTLIGSIKTKSSLPVEERIQNVWHHIRDSVLEPHLHKIKEVGIEQIAFGSRGQRKDQLAGLHFYLRIRISVNYEFLAVSYPSASAIKKFITGKGNAKKDMMLLSTYKKFGFETFNDNICDAYCIARYLHSIRMKES